MTLDERIQALTESVELLASIHKDNEARAAENESRAARRDKRRARLESALMIGIAAFMQEWTREDEAEEDGRCFIAERARPPWITSPSCASTSGRSPPSST